MFGQLTFMRLKAAEKALRDGRLDEAYRIATAPDLREHKKAAAVLADLAERFLERAREHFRADRFSDALMDLDRAEAGGQLKDRVAELRGHVQAVAAEEQRKDHLRKDRLHQAARRIQDGSLAAGRMILENASGNDPAAQQLRRVVDQRADEAAELLAQVENLVNEGQWPAAVARLRKARGVDAHHPDFARIESTLCGRILTHAREALNAGRLSRAADELACMGDLAANTPARKELANALSLANEAAKCLAGGQYADARRHTMSLERLLPDAVWVRDSVEQLRRIDELKTALAAGPFGERLGAVPAVPSPVPAARLHETVGIGVRIPLVVGLPDRLLLLVDGCGSFLLLRGPRASLGRAASDNPADVPVFSDLAERHADIARIDDDYFLMSGRDVEVGSAMTRHALLRDGDRLVLGRKGKLTFRLPSRQSLTAALDLSDTTKMPNDVRRVLLFHQHATIGSGSTAHVRFTRAAGSLVLFERGGALWIRPKTDGHADPGAKLLTIGEPTEIAGVRLTLEPWKIHGPSRVV